MSAPGSVRRAATTRTDWETPAEVFDALNREFRFTLDAAASDTNHKCERYLTVEEDGLKSDWLDNVVWINPPYGAGLVRWVAKAYEASRRGATVVALLPSSVDTKWFRSAFHTADEIRIVYGRIQFVGTTSSNPHGSIVCVWRACSRRSGKADVSVWSPT